MNRRDFLRTTSLVAGAALSDVPGMSSHAFAQRKPQRKGGTFIKLSCNLYCFNEPLTKGSMTLEEVFDFCAELGFLAVDPTGYYFPKYPQLPPDEYVYDLKRKAHLLGLDISGTGIRTDFTDADPAKRDTEVQFTQSWTECAAKMGAPVMRIFSGKALADQQARGEVAVWVAAAIRKCADHGAKFGVMMALQNHADFIQTADDNLDLLKRIDSDWLGANLDIGSFRTADPYEEIARLAPYAITWQIKENVFVRGKETKTDLNKIATILKDARYRGYIQLETLGAGDPEVKLPRFLDEVRTAIA